MRTEKGETVFVSPFTGERFTSQFAYNDHLSRWPAIAAENGLHLDGTPIGSEPPGLADMTIAQLREVAAAEGLDLGAATKKADIVAAIEAARATPVPSEDLLALFRAGDDALLKADDLRRLLDEREVPYGEDDDHEALSAALAASLAGEQQPSDPQE